MVSTILLIGTVIAVMITGIIVASIGWLLYTRWAVRSGRRGEESMWATELITEGDEAFIRAMRNTPNERLAEFGKMADDKEELRKLTVTHYEKDIRPQVENNES